MMLTTGHAGATPFQPSFGVRREGNQLFAQATGTRAWPVDGLVPPIAGELLPESESSFFERLGAAPITFSRDSQGHADGLTAFRRGVSYSFKRISDEPPKAPDPPRRPIVVKLDTKILDAFVGHYEFAPTSTSSTGVRLAIWRNADQLVAQFWG